MATSGKLISGSSMPIFQLSLVMNTREEERHKEGREEEEEGKEKEGLRDCKTTAIISPARLIAASSTHFVNDFMI